MQIAPNVFTLPPSMLSSPALVITPFSPHKNLLWGIKSQMNILLIMSRFSPVQFSSVTQVVSDPLRPHGLQRARLPSLSPTLGACSNSCPLSWWCHPAISSSIVPFSSCLPSYPAPGSLLMNQFFISGGQSIEVSASASVLPMNIQDWFLLGLTGLILLQSKGLQTAFLQPHSSKGVNFSVLSFLHGPTVTSMHEYLINHSFD